jgi:hypothetical protein
VSRLVRRDWAVHRANTWGKLARSGRIVHYSELRKLLIGHASLLASRIGRGEHITAGRAGVDSRVTGEPMVVPWTTS